MHIGLIGGIGPAGTISYYRTLARLHAERGHPLPLTIANAELRDMVDNFARGDAEAQAAIFRRHAEALKRAGCDLVAIGAIGGHFCVDEFKRVSPLPVVDAIAALDDYFRVHRYRTIGVLGLRSVMETGVFGVSTVELITPTPEQVEEVHACYLAMSLAGEPTGEQRDYLHATARDLCNRSAEAVLLAGVDLSLAFNTPLEGVRILDSAVIHAEAISRRSLGEAGPGE